jgi:hypothetical protein
MTALSSPHERSRLARLSPRRRSNIALVARYLGALAVLGTGVAHLEQYTVDDFSTVPTIGTLFLLNFIGAVVIAVGLVVPLGRYTGAVRTLMAVAGIALGVLSLVALLISEGSGLFGFVENGYRMAIVVAIVAEAAAAVLLAVFLLVTTKSR